MRFIETILTLKAKLVFLFLTLAIGPLIVIGAFSIDTTEALIKRLVLRQLENVAADKAAILERWLDERKQDLQVIAGTSILKSMDPTAIVPYLALIQEHYGVYRNITVVSADDEMIVSTEGPYSAIDFIRNHSGGRDGLFMSNISYLSEEKESIFYIAAPIFHLNRRLGMVYGTVGTHSIINTILRVSLGQTGECYLVDNEGRFLVHKEPRRILSENISQSASFKNIFGNRDRIDDTYLDYRNIEVLGTSQKVGGTDWYIVVEQDREEAFQSVEKLKNQVYLTLLLAASSALLLTWVISFHVVRPIRALSRSAQTLANADEDIGDIPDARTNRQDEIGLLCRAFTDMALKIRERQDNLEHQFNLKEAELKETGHTLKQFQLIAERSEKFAALGRLGAAVAHEIRTPLTSLKLFLESVEAEIEISPEYAEDFTVAMGQIARIEAAINRLLEFTKPKDMFFTRLDVGRLITDVVSIIKPLANKQECTIKIDVEEALPPIDADQKLLEEALINLFINALEAMPDHGRIAVSAARDTFEAEGGLRSCIRIDISDSGQGIADQQLDLIFDPFFTTKAAGTGLGLPMVLNTIKRHGGEIRVCNQVGGTVFSLFLPITAPTPEAYGKDSAH
ncbi:HAMP domain-containing histidine kinase [Desulfatitalea tepidiphila]|uniref:HAMP domain-containing histidine kinase n=1 Tax=Desulfatitalea tepidiphila TaxID=1185843 RepID=UPI0006B56A75|nr:HAMP domain-containing histidine kinase [Desulfatitalea tepidiphila]